MEFKGTKGEWYYDKVNSKGIKCNSVKGLLATSWNTYNANEVEVRLEGESWLSMRDRTKNVRLSCEDEKISNAKLIAAAPELLKALQISIKSMKLADELEFSDEINIAKKAINKALT